MRFGQQVSPMPETLINFSMPETATAMASVFYPFLHIPKGGALSDIEPVSKTHRQIGPRDVCAAVANFPLFQFGYFRNHSAALKTSAPVSNCSRASRA